MIVFVKVVFLNPYFQSLRAAGIAYFPDGAPQIAAIYEVFEFPAPLTQHFYVVRIAERSHNAFEPHARIDVQFDCL